MPSEVSSSGAAQETGIVGQCHATCTVQQLLENVQGIIVDVTC